MARLQALFLALLLLNSTTCTAGEEVPSCYNKGVVPGGFSQVDAPFSYYVSSATVRASRLTIDRKLQLHLLVLDVLAEDRSPDLRQNDGRFAVSVDCID